MSKAIVWFRQDLRVHDNPALTAACCQHSMVMPLYILDEVSTYLGGAQKWWLHHSLISLDNGLNNMDLGLCLRQGRALEVLERLVREHQIEAIYWNRCYEPLAIERDTLIKTFFQQRGIQVRSTNGCLLNEPWTMTTTTGHFFKVFTPFWRACLKKMAIPAPHMIADVPRFLAVQSDHLADWKLTPVKPNWATAFELSWQPGEEGAHQKLTTFVTTHLQGYQHTRDEPAKGSTSQLSPHLHFGEISPWDIWRTLESMKSKTDCDHLSIERFLSEIGWREFSYHLLYHVPSLPDANFKSAFDAFPWKNDPVSLSRWQRGLTGYPIVDAGMRELWQTGYMHNRVRMLVASFLTKDLLIDWRLGARWFLDTLVDADLASNSASWQWVAGCGADAAPYFRIFNPVLQGEKFDPEGHYVKKWVPELKHVPLRWLHKPWMAPQDLLGFCLGKTYPKPLVDHHEARKQALLYYKTMGKNHLETKE